MKDIKDFLKNFIEKESEAFSGFPVCPFAKKERLQNKIKFVECSFNNINPEKIIEECEFWLNSDYSTLLFVSDKDCSMKATRHFIKCINSLLSEHNVNTFLFHEQDQRSFMGVYTRRSPRPFIMIGHSKEISLKKTKLLKTNYYDNLNFKEYFQLHPKRKTMGKIKSIIEKLKKEEKLTTKEVLTKYPDLAILLEKEEQREKLDESRNERVLLKG